MGSCGRVSSNLSRSPPSQCAFAISQLAKGRSKDQESADLQSLAAEALLRDYKQRAPDKVALLTATLRGMRLIS